jgi:hypothetical protein
MALRRRRARQDHEDEQAIFDSVVAADPTFAERFNAYEQGREQVERALAGVVADLHAAGIEIRDVSDLRGQDAPIQAATPVLLRWLPMVDPPAKNVLIQVLGDRRCGPAAARALVAAYRAGTSSAEDSSVYGVRAAIASALRNHDVNALFEEFESMAIDRSAGSDRALILWALAKPKRRRSEAISIARSQLDDPSVRTVALEVLGRLRAVEAWAEMAAYEHDADPDVRRAAKRALKRLPQR